jgi:uroporphyrinogen decarboxylase
MNGLERVSAAVKFEHTDRVPVIAQVFAHAATLSGIPIDDYVRDGETLARCQLKALNRYDYDAVFSVMDVNVEAEAAGAVLQYRKNQYPVIEHYAFSAGQRWNASALPDPKRAGRMPEMLKALRILRLEAGNEVLVVGCVTGPFTLATQLIGMETALNMAIDDSPQLEGLMDFATGVIIRFGLAQIASGAHLPIVFNPSASPAVVPPQFFREFELPRLKRVFDAFAEAGSLANWLHIAGPSRRILPYYTKAGVTIANFDYCVSALDARRELPTTCLNGNIKPVTFVEGSPEDIEAEARSLVNALHHSGGFILSSGCEIPPESKPANVAALVGAACVK